MQENLNSEDAKEKKMVKFIISELIPGDYLVFHGHIVIFERFLRLN